jgi:hypothetical protein
LQCGSRRRAQGGREKGRHTATHCSPQAVRCCGLTWSVNDRTSRLCGTALLASKLALQQHMVCDSRSHLNHTGPNQHSQHIAVQQVLGAQRRSLEASNCTCCQVPAPYQSAGLLQSLKAILPCQRHNGCPLPNAY